MSFYGKFIKCGLINKRKTKRRPKIGIWSAFRLKAVKQTIVSALGYCSEWVGGIVLQEVLQIDTSDISMDTMYLIILT